MLLISFSIIAVFLCDFFFPFPYLRLINPLLSKLASLCLRYLHYEHTNLLYLGMMCVLFLLYKSYLSCCEGIQSHFLRFSIHFFLLYILFGFGAFFVFFRRCVQLPQLKKDWLYEFSAIVIPASDQMYAKFFLLFYRHLFASLFYYLCFGYVGLMVYRVISFVCSEEYRGHGLQPQRLFFWLNWIPLRLFLLFLSVLGWSRQILPLVLSPRVWLSHTDEQICIKLLEYRQNSARDAVLVFDETDPHILEPQAREYQVLFLRLLLIMMVCVIVIGFFREL